MGRGGTCHPHGVQPLGNCLLDGGHNIRQTGAVLNLHHAANVAKSEKFVSVFCVYNGGWQLWNTTSVLKQR